MADDTKRGSRGRRKTDTELGAVATGAGGGKMRSAPPRPTRATAPEREQAPERDQAKVYGRNPPAPDDDQQTLGSGMTDIADVAQNNMPGTPQVLVVDPREELEEPRRRAFDKAVAEHEKKAKKKGGKTS